MPASRSFTTQSAKQITLISLVALLLGHLMEDIYIPSRALFLLGLCVTSFYIFHNTLRKNDIFSFLMVIYFCSNFPYLLSKGGAFNMVSFVCIGLYILFLKKVPAEKRIRDVWFNRFVGLWVLSCIIGWLINYTGNTINFIYSFLTFFGIIFLLILSTSLEITRERIKVFIQLNIILIIYALITSINKYFHIITFTTPMMPIYPGEHSYFEGGGLLGCSPFYGEHSMILLILFSVFYIISKENIIKKSTLLAAAFIASVNIFMSISRSVLLLSIVGIILILIFQFQYKSLRIRIKFWHFLVVLLLGFSVLKVVNKADLGYVFERIMEIQEKNKSAGGLSLDNLIDGSAFNRDIAFALAKQRFESRDNWIIGFGWGTEGNNRNAFFVDPTIKRNTPHSQIFSVLFLFGWIGFIAYWGLILRIIYKSYRTSGNKNVAYINRIFALFFMISFCLFFLNEIKVDSINFPSYFAVSIIWMGLAYSNSNSKITI